MLSLATCPSRHQCREADQLQCCAWPAPASQPCTGSHCTAVGQHLASAGCAEVGLQGEVALYHPKDGRRKTFSFDKAFGEGSGQASVYEDTKALIRSVLDGGHSLWGRPERAVHVCWTAVQPSWCQTVMQPQLGSMCIAAGAPSC